MGITIRPCSPADLERLIPLLDAEFVFGKGRSISLRQRFPAVFCHDNLHHILLCADGEEIVAALAMRPFDWRDGSEIFRGAMIGMVYTQPARRGEGWASRLLTAAATQLRAEGVDFGVLWTGQPAFYARLGWEAADCSLLGEVELEPFSPQSADNVTTLPAQADAPLPLPAERVDWLRCVDNDQAAYALLGSHGTTGFLYELAGHPDSYAALWRAACRGRQRIFVNDRAGSPSWRWLTDHTRISWKNKNLAMWLPLSGRVAMPRLGQWHIPYSDRI